MAFDFPYLAAENSASDRRSRALHRFLVASPFALLLTVGLVGHLRKAPHEGAAGDAGYDARVLAYQGRVAAVERLDLGHIETVSVDRVVTESARWVAGYREGSLKTLAPAYYEDHLREGPRGEVLRAGLNLANVASLSADRSLMADQPYKGAELALLSAEVAHGLDRFEIQGAIQCLLLERRNIGFVAQAWPSLSSSQRDVLRPRLRGLLAKTEDVETMSKREAEQADDYLRRQRLPKDSIPESERFAAEKQRLAVERSATHLNARIAPLLDEPPASSVPATKAAP